MRVDRTLTLSVVRPWRSLVSRGADDCIPILMYHSISPELDDRVGPYFRTVTSPQSFARQIDVLRAAGYEAVTLSQAVALLDAPAPAARRVVITFDDGFRDFLTEAFPVLERAAFTASVFLPSDFIGKPFITGRACLSASEIRTLSDLGIEFGSHSVSHRHLVELGTQELARELSDSKARIEDITGREVGMFSYPFRFPEENPRFTRSLAGIMDECGYRGGVTTAIGRSRRDDDRRFLPRLPMNDCDDAPLLRAKLAGHYDWLRAGQRMRKRTRAAWQRWRGA